jgi:hypothetical protein
MPDVGTLLRKYGPRCVDCGELATRITIPQPGFYLFDVWCEDLSVLIHSNSFDLAKEVANSWMQDLIEVDLVRRGSANLRIDVLEPCRGDGWFYCDKHQSTASVGYQELPRAHLVRGVVVETVPVERPTRFERILGSDAY